MKKLNEMEPYDWLILFLAVLAIASVLLFVLKAIGLIALSWWWVFSPVVVPVVGGIVILVAYADGMSR